MSAGERRLRELVGQLRAEEERSAPPFASFRTARRRPPSARRLGWGVAAASLGLVLWIGLLERTRPTPPTESGLEALAAELSGWQSPLDFLADVPGQEALGEQPLPRGRTRELIETVESESMQPKEVI